MGLAGRSVTRADLVILLVTAAWSVNVVVVKVALHDSGPLFYAAVRFLLGGAGLWLLAWRLEGPVRRPRGRDLALVLTAAALGTAINQASFTGALALNSADFVALVQAATPLMVAGWLAAVSKQHFGRRVWVGFGLGLAGLALVVDTGGGARASALGIVVALIMPASWAAYLLVLPRLLRQYRPLTLSALVTFLGALMLLPFGAVEAVASPPRMSLGWLGLLAYSSLVAVVATTWLFLVGLERLGPARTSAYTYLQPFIAVVAAALLIGEAVLPLQLLGGAIMLVGVALGRPRPRRVGGSRGGSGAPQLSSSPPVAAPPEGVRPRA